MEDNPGKASFIIAYGMVAFSGFLVGLLCGWAMWG